MAGGHGDKMEIADNYLDVLRAACSRPDDEDKPGNLVHNGRRRVSGNFTDGFNQPPAA
jgi:hypothetical protein